MKIRSFLSCTKGQTAVEFALVMPCFLLLAFGIIETGRAMWTRATLQEAASDAARCYAVNTTTCATVDQVKTYAVGRATGLNLPTANVTPLSAACGRQVVITLPFHSAVQGLIPWTITLTAEACFPA